MHKRDPRILAKLKFVFFLGIVLAGLNSNFMVESFSPFLGFSSVEAAGKNIQNQSSVFKVQDVFGYNELQGLLKKSTLLKSGSEEACVSVCVVGEVNFPGQYEHSPSATVLSAILGAGGPNSLGSMRVVKILREEDIYTEYDLYDQLLAGSVDKSPSLSGGETIVVNPSGPRVKVDGMIARPGVYELKKSEKTFGWLLKMAGGISSSLKNGRIEIFRNVRGGTKHLVSEKLEFKDGYMELSEFPLENGDQIEITQGRKYVDSEIQLVGHFRFPGKVILKSGPRLSDLILKENLMFDFVGEYAEILRENGKNDEYQVLCFSPDKVLNGAVGSDLMLKNGDQVVVFSRKNFGSMARVAVEGAVGAPGKFSWKEGQKVSSLIAQAGGLQKDASTVAELSRRSIVNCELQSKSLIIDLRRVLKGDPRHDVRIAPFDLLSISKK